MKNYKIAIIGLGYVGLPLAVEFAKHFDVLGFDVDHNRIKSLRNSIDITNEVSAEALNSSKTKFTDNDAELVSCNVYIVTVPTPIDKHKKPDLSPLISASQTIGSTLQQGDIVIYESTVYPGATEEECVPILSQTSGLTFNQDYFVGYSPERINPGDKSRGVSDITKVISGSNEQTLEVLEYIYGTVIKAGIHKTSSIKVAEAAKVIENTQRDVNIALINELAIIFNKLGIDTEEVLIAAGTKWNFLPFRPGLVGGHCIGIDPYYLTHKAKSLGHHPKIILAGRYINDGMGSYVGQQFIKALVKQKIELTTSKILILGLTFKENCPDLRNTKVVDIIKELSDFGIQVDIFDPIMKQEQLHLVDDLNIITDPEEQVYDGVVIAVAHKEFADAGLTQIKSYLKPNHVIYDLKYMFSQKETQLRL